MHCFYLSNCTVLFVQKIYVEFIVSDFDFTLLSTMQSNTCKLIDSLFSSVGTHCKKAPVSTLAPDVLIGLHSVFGGVLSAALDIIDRSGVIIYICAKGCSFQDFV